MLIRVLGSAAGGGFPQWNCGCPNCRGVRGGSIRASARTQECVAVSADGESAWVLLNCSPEIRSQIESFPPLHPRGPRDSPIAAIVLTNGDLDHCLGLLSLRESHRLTVYATDAVQRGFTRGNVLYRTLERFPGQVTWRLMKIGCAEAIVDADGRPTGLTAEAIVTPGKPPVHLEEQKSPEPEDSVGVCVREVRTGRVLAYLSGVASITDDVRRALTGADAVFFDGTFWSSDELPAQGLGSKRAEQMAHLPVAGPNGSLAQLAGVRAGRRIYIHVNNTNPMLREDSSERAAVTAAGWDVAWDGMEVRL
jgi:pyrroloquinoline quinone biosynthesis protein B